MKAPISRYLTNVQFELVMNKLLPVLEFPIIDNCSPNDYFIFKRVPKLSFKEIRFNTGNKFQLVQEQVRVRISSIVAVYEFGLRSTKCIYSLDLNTLELSIVDIKLN